jgi:hypothetical protein
MFPVALIVGLVVAAIDIYRIVRIDLPAARTRAAGEIAALA